MGRFSRQEVLQEVGPPGQARICAATFVAPLLGATPVVAYYAQLYATRAGLKPADTPASRDAPSGSGSVPGWVGTYFRHSCAQDLGAGASVALSQVLAALDGTSQDQFE